MTTGTILKRIGAVGLDAAAAAGCYLMAYRLRFEGSELSLFLPAALRSLPLVAGAQLLGFALTGLYGRERDHWFRRVIAGVFIGTGLGAALTAALLGFEGISRISFVTDGALLALVAFGWRCAAAVGLRPLAGDPVEELDDRTDAARSSAAGLLSVFRYRELLRNLVLRDLKLKYRGSAFGFLWSLMNPLLMIAIYSAAFTIILQIRTAGFVFYLMLGVLAWTFFASSAAMSTGSLVDSSGLMKSVSFPRVILPVATVLFNLAQYLLTVLVFLPVMLIIYQVPLSPPMLLFPVFLTFQIVFTVGVALLLSTGTAFFRDIRHLLEVALGIMFWTTPIVYELDHVPEALRGPILLSPLSPFIASYQQMFFYREWPDPSIWLLAVAYALTSFVAGAAVFVTYEDQITEYL